MHEWTAVFGYTCLWFVVDADASFKTALWGLGRLHPVVLAIASFLPLVVSVASMIAQFPPVEEMAAEAAAMEDGDVAGRQYSKRLDVHVGACLQQQIELQLH